MERLGSLVGAMVVDGVEVGGDESPPTNAIVGSELVAMRSSLSQYMGWDLSLSDFSCVVVDMLGKS